MIEQEKNYLLAFDKVEKLSDYSIATNYANKDEKKKAITDDFLTFLIEAYLLGITEVGSQLKVDLKPSRDRMYDAIYKNIAGETFEGRVSRHVDADDDYALRRLIDSEFHRVYSTATMDGAEQAEAILGSDVVITKSWHTMLDWRVRDTHDWLEGVQVGLHERFYTYDGDSARYPGDFAYASNNVACRCFLSFSRY